MSHDDKEWKCSMSNRVTCMHDASTCSTTFTSLSVAKNLAQCFKIIKIQLKENCNQNEAFLVRGN